MKYFSLIIFIIALSANLHATFELEDPADPEKQAEREEKQKPIFGSKVIRKQVVIVAGTELYTPTIEDGSCIGWSQDMTGSDRADTAVTGDNLVGNVVQTVKCNNGAEAMKFSLVRTGGERLLWVESGKLLSAD